MMAVVAACAFLVAGCAQADPPSSPKAPEVLTESKAGRLYLDAVCPVNEAWGEADVELDRLRIAQGRGDAEADTDAFARAMREVGKRSDAAAQRLEPENLAWPSGAQRKIEAVRESLRDDAKEAAEVAEMTADEAAGYTWNGAEAAGATAEAARKALGLPEDPMAACNQWAERQAVERAEKPTKKG